MLIRCESFPVEKCSCYTLQLKYSLLSNWNTVSILSDLKTRALAGRDKSVELRRETRVENIALTWKHFINCIQDVDNTTFFAPS